jgi:hypothetical protein
VVWVKLANIGLFISVLMMGVVILKEWKLSPRTAAIWALLCGLNGTISWMVVRNLKDTMFLFLSVFDIYVVRSLFYSSPDRINRVQKYAVSLPFSIFLGSFLKFIRPWGLYQAMMVLVAISIEELYTNRILQRWDKKRMKCVLLAGGAVVISAAALVIGPMVKKDLPVLVTYSSTFAGLAGTSPLQFAPAIARFFIGPGPIRAALGNQTFEVTTQVGNILVLLGSAAWWAMMPLFIMAVLQGPRYWLRYSSVLMPLVAFVSIYCFAYSGVAETRIRAFVYVLAMLFSGPVMESLVRRPSKENIWTYSGFFALVLIFGVASSYLTL